MIKRLIRFYYKIRSAIHEWMTYRVYINSIGERDQNQINAALYHAHATKLPFWKRHRTVHLAPGVYNIDKPITLRSNTRLVGESYDSVTIKS